MISQGAVNLDCWLQGRIFMTHPTKAICGTLLKDFIKLSGGKDGEPLYKAADLTNALEKSEVLDFHQTVDINGIKVIVVGQCIHVNRRACCHARFATHTSSILAVLSGMSKADAG